MLKKIISQKFDARLKPKNIPDICLGCFWFAVCDQSSTDYLSLIVVFTLLHHAEDRVNFIHDLRGQFLDELRRLHILMHLLHAARAGDDRADEGILQTPRQRQLGKSRADLFCNRLKRGDLLKAFLVGQAAVQPFITFERPAAVFGNAALILPRKKARSQRTPNGGAVAVIGIKTDIIELSIKG